jgi:hypothetical protein
MAVKVRKFLQARHKPTDFGHTLRALFQAKRAVRREQLPVGMASRTGRTRHALADTFAQAQMGTAAMDEEVCAGCCLERHLWKGSKGKGYPRDGERYCCQPCADELECACQQ